MLSNTKSLLFRKNSQLLIVGNDFKNTALIVAEYFRANRFKAVKRFFCRVAVAVAGAALDHRDFRTYCAEKRVAGGIFRAMVGDFQNVSADIEFLNEIILNAETDVRG